jgi:hypothetical protein
MTSGAYKFVLVFRRFRTTFEPLGASLLQTMPACVSIEVWKGRARARRLKQYKLNCAAREGMATAMEGSNGGVWEEKEKVA